MSATPFPNYLQLPTTVPLPLWHVARAVTITAAAGLCVLLVASPADGLRAWWGVAVPLLPALFLIAPGLWRNVCPLAGVNQVPRYLRFTRGLTAPGWFRDYAPAIGMVLFLAAVASREPLFNDSGVASAALIGGALVAAFVGGTVLKGKSGWCSSICPLLGVQRVYGQTPFVTVPNSHCRPCLGCARNCYDFNPRVAYLADLHDGDRHWSATRKLFVGAFPGVVLAYFAGPDLDDVGVVEYYLGFLLIVAASAGSFFALEAVVRVTSNTLTAVYGAAAFCLYYWWSVPVLSDAVLGGEPEALVWGLRVALLVPAAIWVWRTWRKEAVYLEQVGAQSAPTGEGGVTLGAGSVLDKLRAEQAEDPEVVFEADGPRVVARPGATLLEVIERAQQPIESGCRMGVCGADPICVLDGADHLSPMGDDERATIERLGLAPSTRMACCARVEGPVRISLTPARADVDVPAAAVVEGFDRSVERVVVIGNGIAGVTAADHVRRNHPDCEIDVVAAEAHALYNRMGISRLIYGRSAMKGLHLLPDDWWDANRVTCWLNTRATAIDRQTRTVRVGTGEELRYDRLVLATGSLPYLPPIEGWPLPGAVVLRSADDALGVRSYVQRHGAREALVAGGGLLGLEAADALRKLGLRATVLERGDRLLRRQLDGTGARLLQSFLEGLGIAIELNAEVAAVHGEERLRSVSLYDGRVLETDLLMVSAGIVPDVELAAAAGLAVDRGVLVDDAMRTSDPLIYAAGDVAEHHGRVLGLWPSAVEQAETAARNIAGAESVFAYVPPITMLKVAGVQLTSCGELTGDDEIAEANADAGTYRKLVLRDGHAAGAIMLGHPALAPAVTQLVRSAAPMDGMADALRRGDWSGLE